MTKSTLIRKLAAAGSHFPELDYEILKEVVHAEGWRVSDIQSLDGYSDGYTDFGHKAIVEFSPLHFCFFWLG